MLLALNNANLNYESYPSFSRLPHDILSDVKITDDSLSDTEKLKRGLSYMEIAGRAMDRSSMVFLAQSYELGINGAKLNPNQALYWYESIIALDEDEVGEERGSTFTDEMNLEYPPYIMVAKSAELWNSGLLNQGRNHFKARELFNQAAEVAMTCMKGKLANKYYMMAEEVWSKIEE